MTSAFALRAVLIQLNSTIVCFNLIWKYFISISRWKWQGNGVCVCGCFDVKKMRSPATSEKKPTQTARALFCCVGGYVWGVQQYVLPDTVLTVSLSPLSSIATVSAAREKEINKTVKESRLPPPPPLLLFGSFLVRISFIFLSDLRRIAGGAVVLHLSTSDKKKKKKSRRLHESKQKWWVRGLRKDPEKDLARRRRRHCYPRPIRKWTALALLSVVNFDKKERVEQDFYIVIAQ